MNENRRHFRPLEDTHSTSECLLRASEHPAQNPCSSSDAQWGDSWKLTAWLDQGSVGLSGCCPSQTSRHLALDTCFCLTNIKLKARDTLMNTLRVSCLLIYFWSSSHWHRQRRSHCYSSCFQGELSFPGYWFHLEISLKAPPNMLWSLCQLLSLTTALSPIPTRRGPVLQLRCAFPSVC